jgi:hypothetical protein
MLLEQVSTPLERSGRNLNGGLSRRGRRWAKSPMKTASAILGCHGRRAACHIARRLPRGSFRGSESVSSRSRRKFPRLAQIGTALPPRTTRRSAPSNRCRTPTGSSLRNLRDTARDRGYGGVEDFVSRCLPQSPSFAIATPDRRDEPSRSTTPSAGHGDGGSSQSREGRH